MIRNMEIVLLIISLIIMLANVLCIYILVKSIKVNKEVKSMNDIIENVKELKNNNKFIIRNKKCESLTWLMHIALNNNDPILILDVE